MNRLFSKRKLGSLALRSLLPWLPPKQSVAPNSKVGICMLVCHKDVMMAIYSLKSLFFQLGYELPIYMVSDGSLTPSDYQKLRHHFTVQIEDVTQTTPRMKKVLKKYPYVAEHRFVTSTEAYKLKLDVLLFCPFEKYIYMDADILFFRPPTEIIKWLESNSRTNYYTAHLEQFFEDEYYPEFSLRKLLYKHLNVQMTAGFSSGLFLVSNKKALSLSDMNTLFKLYKSISALHHEVLEENALSVLCGQWAFKCLPSDTYRVMSLYNEYVGAVAAKNRVVIMHFGWETKNKFFTHALELAFKHRFFKSPKTQTLQS